MLLRSLLFEASSTSLQRVVVTGASSGIGMAFARALPHAHLLLTGRDAVALESLASELRAGTERQVSVVTADLADLGERAELIEAARMFEPDLLINNAGTGTYGPFLDVALEDSEATALVDALAPLVLSRALLPGMIDRAQSRGARCGLINVASVLAFAPFPDAAVYAASKAFVLSLTQALAAELAGRPVDVLAVCPGAVRTEFFRRAGSPGLPPGAVTPERVARRALADLGRFTVSFTDPASTLLLRPAADARAVLSRAVATTMGAVRALSTRPQA